MDLPMTGIAKRDEILFRVITQVNGERPFFRATFFFL
jgi:hypothetical protein